MTTPDSTQIYHEKLQQFFSETARRIAKETKFVQCESPLTGELFLLTLTLTVLQYGSIVLDQLAKTAARVNPAVKLTGQAFKARFNAFAVAFLKAMFVEALQLSVPGAARVVPLLQNFSAVYLLDATTVAFPDALATDFLGCGGAGPKAAAKVYLLCNWLTGKYETLRVEPGRQPDQNMGSKFVAGRAAGALWLFDLGFFNAAFLADIARAGSFFLCRLAAAQQVFWVPQTDGSLARFDLDALLRQAPRELFETNVVFGPKREVQTRLICAPVPADVAAQRRRRAREAARKQGRTPTQKSLQRCDWTLLLTNASAADLPTSTVAEVYRVRWQIELVFKLYKSDAQLAHTNAREAQRIKCEFYAKLIALVLFERLSGVAEDLAGAPISAVKLWRRLRHDVQDWLCLLGQGRAAAVTTLLKGLLRYAQPSSKQRHPAPRQRLAQAGRAAQQVQLAEPLAYLQQPLRGARANQKAFAAALTRQAVTLEPARLSCQRTTAQS